MKISFYQTLLLVGNFVDLVNKKFYDGMPIQKEEQLTLQTGKPKSGDGYVDPTTKQVCNYHFKKIFCLHLSISYYLLYTVSHTFIACIRTNVCLWTVVSTYRTYGKIPGKKKNS